MSLCDVCIKPGACCEGFILNIEQTWKSEGFGGPLRQMAQLGLPFLPESVSHEFTDQKTGQTFQAWKLRCTNIMPNGRCGDYENRPTLCRSYEPMHDNLCVMKAGHLLPRPLP